MPSLDDIQSRAVAAVDRTFAEPLELLFLNKGRVDTARRNLTASGVLRVGRGASDSPAGRVQSWGSRIASGKAQAHFARDAYAGPPIRKGDKLKAVNRPGQPLFEVAMVDDREPGRIVLHLTEA